MLHFYWFSFKGLARGLFLPPMGLWILVALGVALIASRHRRSGWACLGVGLGLLWLLSTPMVATELTRLAQVYPAFNPATPTNAQAIVILGGEDARFRAPEYGGQPAVSLELLERLDYGAWLSRTTHLPVLVSSGNDDTYAMAVSMSRDFQVPPRWIERRSLDTYDNARFSVAMLRADHVNSILLVTSSVHMLRAMREFQATGLQVTAAPVHVVGPRGQYGMLPTAEGMMYSNRAIYELIGEPVRELLAALHVRRQPRG